MGKLKKEKHNHKLTDFLKVGIFSLVMLAPFISIGSKMAYVTFNKNAKDSYYGETINEYNYKYIHANNEFIINNEYYCNISNYNQSDLEGLVLGGSGNRVTFHNVNVITNTTNYDIPSIIQISFWKDSNNLLYAYSYDVEGNQIFGGLNTKTNTLIFSFDFSSSEIWDILLENTNIFYELEYNNYSYLDNVFEYAVNQLGETQIFAWTKNTAIYTPIETMTNGLGFDPNNNTLAILLTYWSLVTAVYVIMDIILFAFTKITHFIQD